MQQLTCEIEKTWAVLGFGLRINDNKCKIMVSNDWEDNTAVGLSLITEGAEVELVEDFCYLSRSYSTTTRVRHPQRSTTIAMTTVPLLHQLHWLPIGYRE